MRKDRYGGGFLYLICGMGWRGVDSLATTLLGFKVMLLSKVEYVYLLVGLLPALLGEIT